MKDSFILINQNPYWMQVAKKELNAKVKENTEKVVIDPKVTPKVGQLPADVLLKALQLDQAIGHPMKERGYEVTDKTFTFHKSDPAVQKYYEAVKVWGGRDITGKTNGGNRVNTPSDSVPWCAAFVNWCLMQADIKGTESAGANSFQNWGSGLHAPTYGCIAVVNRPGGKHVGFYLKTNGNKIVLLGGNQSNKVSDTGEYPLQEASFRWPFQFSAVLTDTSSIA